MFVERSAAAKEGAGHEAFETKASVKEAEGAAKVQATEAPTVHAGKEAGHEEAAQGAVQAGEEERAAAGEAGGESTFTEKWLRLDLAANPEKEIEEDIVGELVRRHARWIKGAGAGVE